MEDNMDQGFYAVVAMNVDGRIVCQWSYPDFDAAYEKFDSKREQLKKAAVDVEAARNEEALECENLYLAGPFAWGENVNSDVSYGPAKVLRVFSRS
jgi:hypothetical protein